MHSTDRWNTNPNVNNIALMFDFAREATRTEGAQFKPQTLCNAGDFLASLPPGFRCPEFATGPVGDIAMDWMASRTRMVSISIGESKLVPIAWGRDGKTGFDISEFVGSDALANKIVSLVNLVFAD
jgi:hypothetical protein